MHVVTFYKFSRKYNIISHTMHNIYSIVRNLETMNHPPNQTEMYKDVMSKGNELIRMAPHIHKSWNPFKRYNFWRKLREFQETLVTFCQVQMSTEQLRSTWRISKDVKDLIELVKKEMNRINETLDSINQDDYWGYCGYAQLPEIIVGLEGPLAELKVILLNNEVQETQQSELVVVSAPPGCGKTVLANLVCRDSQIKDKFKDNIFFVSVSKTFDVKVIVKKLFQQKGCLDKLLLDIQSDEDAIIQLRNLFNRIGGGLDQKPILLVLDDVWSSVFRSLVEKFKFKGIPGYKILVTSRYEPHGFQFVSRLKLLDHEDARKLFCYYAFPSQNTHPHDLDGYVDKIIIGCRGFPLALKVIGISLCDKHEVAWKTTLNNWSLGQSTIFSSDNEMLQKLKTSVDALDEENDMKIVKECFLDLASFPEDQRIPASALLDMWSELYDLNDVEDMATYSNLLELSDRNLLSLVPTRKYETSGLVSYCSRQYVTQHDLLRELAIYLISQEAIKLRKRFIMEIGENGLPSEWADNLHKPFNAHLVSITIDDSFTSTLHDMRFPEAKVLILNFRQKSYTLPEIMKHMTKLNVLILTNYGFHPADVLNIPMLRFLTSLKRMRFEHVSIPPTFAFLTMELLKKISLVMCKIGNALHNSARMFPFLEEIVIEYCRDLLELPASLCDIVSLKRISIDSCNELRALPDEIERLENLESLRLNSCTKLEELPQKIVRLNKLSLLDLTDCTNLSQMPQGIGELSALTKLHMRGCYGLLELPSSVEKFKILKVICDKYTACLWKFHTNVQVIEVKEDINLDWLHN